jgi:hypothetical protein
VVLFLLVDSNEHIMVDLCLKISYIIFLWLTTDVCAGDITPFVPHGMPDEYEEWTIIE